MIKPIFLKSGKWTQAVRKRENRSQSLLLTVSNKELVLYLESKNYLIKSGANPNILYDIPEDLQKYWWRGYLDADGCIYYNKNRCLKQLCFSLTYSQDWTFCEDLFNKMNIKYKVLLNKTKKSKSSVIRILALDIIKLCDYIYSGEQFGYKRKYDKYLLIKNHKFEKFNNKFIP